jgi:16S rRNA (cytidine1402-2'-O)-methyltransferase
MGATFERTMPTLYLVATPIGNLEDVTLRALRVLREVALIAAEDTRTTRKLLAHHGIRARLTSYHEHNKAQKIPYLLSALEQGDVALVSEAGMPAVSDPGVDLVAAAVAAGAAVVAIPGPSAVVTALAVSGLPTRQFTYVGFLPRRAAERRRLLSTLANEPRTIVALESPHRLLASLTDLLAALGDRRIAVCRELTKLHEEVFRGRISEALAHFSEPRGEFTLVIEGAAEGGSAPPDEAAVQAELQRLRKRGLGARRAVDEVALRFGLPRRQAYRLWLQAKDEPGQ